jgi:hypothetical protein
MSDQKHEIKHSPEILELHRKFTSKEISSANTPVNEYMKVRNRLISAGLHVPKKQTGRVSKRGKTTEEHERALKKYRHDYYLKRKAEKQQRDNASEPKRCVASARLNDSNDAK